MHRCLTNFFLTHLSTMKALSLTAVQESLAVIAAGIDHWRDTFPSQQLLAIEPIRVESLYDWNQNTVRRARDRTTGL